MKLASKILFVLFFSILAVGCTQTPAPVSSEEGARQEVLDQVTSLKPENVAALEKTIDSYKKVEILTEDFILDDHYKFLGVYNSPEFSTDFIMNIEAGKMMVNLSQENAELKTSIVRELKDILFQKNLTYLDQKRGAVLYFLSQMLDSEEKTVLKSDIRKNIQIEPTPEGFPPTYTEYYLNQFINL